jgi:DNA-binding MarR family transcriptional regulator
VKEVYIETILLIERLHRRFLDVIKTELDRLKIEEINNVQTLILYNINSEQITIGELTNRGYYLGSNVSYNVKDLVEKGFLIKERSTHDKRSTRVKLSDKGLALCAKIDELYKRHIESLKNGKPNINTLPDVNNTLHQLEQFWTSYINNVFRGA